MVNVQCLQFCHTMIRMCSLILISVAVEDFDSAFVVIGLIYTDNCTFYYNS